ncbi:cytochrome P450 [Metschnikowia bicuspidata var. bicuspidata NRRL YB-4993]|uniref:Cytochrome P450 n=1 Tax=Metschnikowia bicuspidata var. bicuspidata NRRL YB-4993 TaxID=869754 RepID=A0A1A0HEV8_9ASCO|nr:cytochrome P450 [Metschnikowia bicuspidata var. bicuspidata NRRL YB-4993]OBA22443.1 cytochrome P450 [Metschnikowia bicuspidata var. bicuspidata NRRL YB-4993]
MLSEILLSVYTEIQGHHQALVSVALLVFVVYNLIVYPFFVSPLRYVPGPYLHRISRIPSLQAQRKFQWVGRVHELHKRYGPVVILTPTSVNCNGDPNHIQNIYVKNMPKGQFYESFRFHGEVNMFAETDNARHLAYKKIVLGLYLKSAIFNPKNTTRDILVGKVRELVHQIYKASILGQQPDSVATVSPSVGLAHEKDKKSGVGINVHLLFASLAMDVVAAFELGKENGTSLLLDSKQRPIVDQLRKMSSMVFWTTRMPRFWAWAAGSAIRNACTEIENWQVALYERAEKHTSQNAPESNLTTLETFRKSALSTLKAYSNISDNLIAGHDTTSTQLTYMCYELSRPVHQKIQARLRDELIQAFGSPSTKEAYIEDLELVDQLPFLEALMQENLRVHSPPGSHYRVTDKCYSVDIKGKTVSIPPGTEISCQPYLMHRVPEIFSDPDNWLPDRWLQTSSESADEYKARVKEMQRYMMPFGRGVRMCLGMNLAFIEIKLALANIYWHYELAISSAWCDVTPAEKSGVIKLGKPLPGLKDDESMMTMEDAYVSHPFHDECWLEWRES